MCVCVSVCVCVCVCVSVCGVCTCARTLCVYETNPISLPTEDHMTITTELQTPFAVLSVHYVSALHSMYGSLKYEATFKWNFYLHIRTGPKIYILLTLPNSDQAARSSHGKRGKHGKYFCFYNGMEVPCYINFRGFRFNT